MKRKSKVSLAASALTAAAGIANVAVKTASTGTGVGLFNIAAASAVNTLAHEKIIKSGLKRKLATCVLVANLIPTAIGLKDLMSNNIPGALSKLSLAGSSIAQCLNGMDIFDGDGVDAVKPRRPKIKTREGEIEL